MATIKKSLLVFLPDTRGVEISSYGRGNLKIGPTVYTYSRLPGHNARPAIGARGSDDLGTCPGATVECEKICYARRVVQEAGVVEKMWASNSRSDDVPPIPEDCRLLRIHVSGDFDTPGYITAWLSRLTERPDVIAWVYTRSWRVPLLLPYLEALRRLPNLQLFASMDKSTVESPPDGWRVAWIDDDLRVTGEGRNRISLGVPGYVCPEETGHKQNCEECRYCFSGFKNDVIFLKHFGTAELPQMTKHKGDAHE